MSKKSKEHGAPATSSAQPPAGAIGTRGRTAAKSSLFGRVMLQRGLRSTAKAALTIAVAVAALLGIFLAGNRGRSSIGSDAYAYAVADPGPGAVAPPLRLAATDGGAFDLAAQRGKTVLLFFQEGLSCQPCWDQIKAIEDNPAPFRSLGIDVVVSITSNPIDLLKQKVADDRITTPVLADPDLVVSKTYGANQYGMMGTATNGHSFVVVGPDGVIRWRADYGGPPNYTMYVPVDRLLADLRAGLNIQDGSHDRSR